MSLRPSLRTACRALALRSRPVAAAASRREPLAWATTRRGYADEAGAGEIPAIRKLGAASEAERAAAAAAKAQNAAAARNQTGEGETEAWTQEDADAAKDMLIDAAAAERPEGGLTEAQEEAYYEEGVIPPTPANGDPIRQLEIMAAGGVVAELQDPFGQMEISGGGNRGHKFPLPSLPLPPHSHLKSRYHPVLDQLTNLMMRDGKKSLAQRNMAMVLNFLRTSPPPIINPRFPLLPGAPPPAHLPLNPVLYMTLAVDSVAPLVKIRRIPGGAGGGRPLELPAPLAVRQRRRMAFQWVLDVVNKKPSKGSGRTQFAHRLAEEIVAVVEGRSPVWDKRLVLHKLGTATRANLGVKPVKQGK
ncbi:30S ribosomal protein S7 [Colletotrichum karsti]|uniref:Small ribosomal subunit protein uS7m n=1 Tax=Colletotrichum karsti TaxID=1095194 RepID=A0A9P6LKE7_9PEZI|nr:30S ribosomal protein S7 [Colletotrichum karsti]KAF9876076.1 30S ribosomal protein S7 [Colletotrichum karsti]